MNTAVQPRPLILAGGKSTRMQSPKHLLQLPNGTPLYRRQMNTLRDACPDAPVIYMSLAKDSPVDAFLQDAEDVPQIEIIYDRMDANNTNTAESGGPARGLLSAFESYPSATWLVVAVDYPLITADAVRWLCREFVPPVTCFRNAEGFCEPLVGVWSPDALRRLQDNAQQARWSPSVVISELGGKQIEPPHGTTWLANVNNKAEWQRALALLH